MVCCHKQSVHPTPLQCYKHPIDKEEENNTVSSAGQCNNSKAAVCQPTCIE